MTRRPLHSALATLWRGGAAVSRAAAALERAERGGGFADLDLAGHPLATVPAWRSLVEGLSADARVAERLLALAGGAAPPLLAARPGGQPTFADRIPSGTSAPMTADGREATSPDRLPSTVLPQVAERAAETPVPAGLKRSAAVFPKDEARNAMQRALEAGAAQAGASHHGEVVPPRAKPPRERAATAMPMPTARTAMSGLSDAARRAASRPLDLAAPSGAARRAAVARVLSGAPAVADTGAQAAGTPVETGADKHLRRLLARVEAAPSTPLRAQLHGPSGMNTRAEPMDTGTAVPSAPASAPPPRNGIERLLAQARRQNLVPTDERETQRGMMPAVTPDIAVPRRPSGVPDHPANAPEPQDIGRALTEIIRREARAAGIDLKGGRS